MKKVYRCLFFAGTLFLLFSAMTEAQAQTTTYQAWREIDPTTGQPNPGLDFMILDRDANHRYVKCAYGNGGRDYNTHPGHTGSGLVTSHALLTPTNGGSGNDPCRCFNSTPSATTPTWARERILPPSWEGDPNNPQDKVIRLGCYKEQGQCLNSQEIEYWFYPPKDSSTLLVLFSFAQENVVNSTHTVDWNPKFYIEVLNESGQVITSPGQYYRECDQSTQTATGSLNNNWPYNRFLASPPGCTTPEYTPCGPDVDGITYYYWAHTASTPSTPTTFQYQVCPAAQTQGNSSYNVTWFQYKPLAFDLSSQAAQGSSVKLRIRAAACQGTAHWAYGLFTAKLMSNVAKVQACGNADIDITVPWGFHEDSYQWFCGTDSISCNRSIEPGVDPGVNGTKYNVVLDPTQTRIFPYYRCEMKSYSGAPFSYWAKIKLYNIVPAFSYKQITDTTDRCSYIIQLRDTGKVYVLTPKANVAGYDTTEETPHKYVEWFYKNTAGGYTEIQPARNQQEYKFHVDAPGNVYKKNFARRDTISLLTGDTAHLPGGDSIWIRIVLRDSMNNCRDTLEKVILLDSSFVMEGQFDTVVSVCKSQLPYFYEEAKYGRADGSFRWNGPGKKACKVGDKNDMLHHKDLSWNGCDSIVNVTVVVIEPKVDIMDLGDYCDSFRTTLTVVPGPDQNGFQQKDIYVLNWNGDESDTNINHLAEQAGMYTVDARIGNREKGCLTSASFKIAACLPFMNLPTSITPSDHNGINDCFEIPQKSLIQSLEFTVYNRNGTVVYHTKDVNFKWRGARNSEDYPERDLVNQTYIYVLKMTDYNGKPYPVMKGTILVL